MVPLPGALETVVLGNACEGTQASQTRDPEPAGGPLSSLENTGGAKDSGGSDESESVITPALGASWSEQGASVPQKTEEISSY